MGSQKCKVQCIPDCTEHDAPKPKRPFAKLEKQGSRKGDNAEIQGKQLSHFPKLNSSIALAETNGEQSLY
jgi:hypothetical protein